MLFLNQRNFRRYGIAAAILGVAAVGATAPAVAAEVKPANIRFASHIRLLSPKSISERPSKRKFPAVRFAPTMRAPCTIFPRRSKR